VFNRAPLTLPSFGALVRLSPGASARLSCASALLRSCASPFLPFYAPGLLPLVIFTSACGAESPTSPSDGSSSTVTAPRLVQPASGATVTLGASPLTLVVENATATPAQTMTYTFEVATDASFSTRVFVQEGVTQGDAGRTSTTVTTTLEPGVAYVWRARAQTASVSGPAADGWSFTTEAEQSLAPPVAIEPASGVVLREPAVEFVLGQGARAGGVSSISYRIEIATDEALSNLVAVLTVSEQASETRVPFDATLELGRTYCWRVKAFAGPVSSEWSPIFSFRAPSVRWPTTGEAVVQFVESRHAAYLQPTSSLAQRQANMAFLRDRLIEAGLCGGIDLGWNLKRGGPEISIDFLTHRVNGRVEGIDIGHDYDNYDRPLDLTWYTGEYPTYLAYSPPPSCQ
jgi:hypothetical protein